MSFRTEFKSHSVTGLIRNPVFYKFSYGCIKKKIQPPKAAAWASAHAFLKVKPEPEALSSQSCGLETAQVAMAHSGRLMALRPGLQNTRHEMI